MILQSENVWPSVRDAVETCVRSSGLLRDWARKRRRADVSDGVDIDSVPAGELPRLVEQAGLWLPEEAVKVLEGGELTQREMMSLAKVAHRCSWDEKKYASCALGKSYNTGPLAVQLRAVARGLDMPVPEKDSRILGSTYEEFSFHAIPTWKAKRYFFVEGLSSVLGEAWPTDRMRKAFRGGWRVLAEDAKREHLSPDTLEPALGYEKEWDYQRSENARAQAATNAQWALVHGWHDVAESVGEIEDSEFGSPEALEAKSFIVSAPPGFSPVPSMLAAPPADTCPSVAGDWWLSGKHVWRRDEYWNFMGLEYGSRWSVAYSVIVLFALGVLVAGAIFGPVQALPLYVVLEALPVLFFWWALRGRSTKLAWAGGVGVFGLLVAARVLLAGDSGEVPAWLGGDDGSFAMLCVGAGALIGIMPVYWGGWFRQVADNVDKYGPFGCVWIRQRDVDGDVGFEFVLTDSAGEIVWIRHMRAKQAVIFSRQFMYGHPDSGMWSLMGAEASGWRQVFPAVLAPRVLQRDWREWWAVARVEGPVRASREPELSALSRPIEGWSWKLLWAGGYPWRSTRFSEAMAIGVPGLTAESIEAYISEFGLDQDPRGYEEALAGGKLVADNAPW